MLATELFQVKNGLLPPFMNTIFEENAQHYHLKKTEFERNNVKIVYNGNETLTSLGLRIWEIVPLSFLGPRIWEIVPDYIKKVTALRNLN